MGSFQYQVAKAGVLKITDINFADTIAQHPDG